jgi:hypothetical protein
MTGADHYQTMIVDCNCAGVAAANAALATFEPRGAYVWLLDDDDACTHPQLVEDLKYLAWLHGNPPAVMVRMNHGSWVGVQPDDKHWRLQPVEGHVGCSAIITRRDVWMYCRKAWASGRYASDFDFISAVWAVHHDRIIWHDVVASRCQRISRGEPEPTYATVRL